MKRPFLQRALEILPGFLTWSTFILPIPLSFFAPTLISVVLLAYAIFWLIKTIVMSYHMILGYLGYKDAMQTNWLEKLQQDFPYPRERDLYHLAIVPTYKEELATLQASFAAIANSDYPLDKLIVVLATEERDRENALKNAKALEEQFGNTFYRFMVTMHPANIPGEVRGKGGNITYAARQVKKDLIDKENIPYEKVIVTTLDADHRVDRQYFACLTYTYLSTPDPIHKSFQPIPLFFNNIWQAAFPMRLIAMGSSFWQMVEATRPHRLRNFASHAQNFAALAQTDFWSVSTIVEDGHQYWRSYFAFDGNHNVVPIFVPIYQDAILTHNFWDSCKEQYLQKRRWAWGASDIPYAVQQALKNKKIPFIEKWTQIFRLIEGHYSWSTTSLVLVFVGWIPILINPDYRETVLAYNFPLYYRYILMSAMIGMIITLVISTILLPPPPNKTGRRRTSFSRYVMEWILTPIIMPFSNIIFGSLPAIESQTRLMFGRYLGEFRVTVKKPVIVDTSTPISPGQAANK